MEIPTNEKRVVKPTFDGKLGKLFEIQLTNLLLSICTFTIYRFWGKTKVRQYLWEHTAIDGDRFSYHGTPKELLVGFAMAAVKYGLPYFVMSGAVNLLTRMNPIFAALKIFPTLFIFGVIFIATLGARRYRLSRTRWRGIYFSFTGDTMPYLRIQMKNLFLQVITLSLYHPYAQIRKHQFLISHTKFGNHSFTFHGKGGDIFSDYLIGLLLSPFTLGLSYLWYMAKVNRYVWKHTRLGPVEFRLTLRAREVLWLMVSNFFIIVFTLGLGMPLATLRTMHRMTNALKMRGLDELNVMQERQAASATLEGASDAFNVDADIGFGG